VTPPPTLAALVATETCPVCGAVDREPADGMSKSGRHYLKHAASPLGISTDELIQRARVFRCTSCDSFFCDPWLTRELASDMFCAGSPDHNAGWTSFETWLRDLKAVDPRYDRLYSAVIRRTGPLRSYAEFGCPFQGFLLQLKGYEADRQARVRAFAGALRRASDVRWSKLTRVYRTLEHIARGAVLAGLCVLGWLDAMRGRRPAAASKPSGPLPSRRHLLTLDTTRGWGSNCVHYGASCQYFAHTVLDADVVPVGEAHRSERFDLIGVFNSLDHTAFPAEVLRSLLDMSARVLLVTHSARHAGKQHQYAFGDGIAAWLTRIHPGVEVDDLGSEVDIENHRDYNYLLLTRRVAG
jgi:hypothetical protein